MNTQQALQPMRTLTSALDRLKTIGISLSIANQQSQRFLDALVGPKPVAGSTNPSGPQIQSTCFVAELHRAIDRIEEETSKAVDQAGDLLAAGGCCDADQSGTATVAEAAWYGRPIGANLATGLYAQGAAALGDQRRG